jgi:hypothetical protein
MQAKNAIDWFLTLTTAASAFVLATLAADPVAARDDEDNHGATASVVFVTTNHSNTRAADPKEPLTRLPCTNTPRGVRLHVCQNQRRVGGKTISVGDRLIHELLEEPTVILPRRAGGLRHVNADQFFFGVNPEKRAAVAAPRVFPHRSG